MQRVGMNAYYYAPKDDPYHRSRWRDPYPPREHRQLQQLVDTARAFGIDFYYSISPGLTMVYSDAADWRELDQKINAIGEMGVRHFALMLDDVPYTLRHAADRRTFTNLADAHAHLINQLHEALSARGAHLVVTPTTYTNAWGDRDYLRQLGQAVPRSIPFFWTGTDVASPEITTQQALEWGELTGRPPIIWDNYPVNDYARWRLFLGPLRGRDPDLARGAVGIIANPMNQAHWSMLPLATVAAYGKDPDGYSPATAHGDAVVAAFGVTAGAVLAPFVDVFGDYGWDLNLFEPLYAPGLSIDVPATLQGLGRLEQQLDSLAGSGIRYATDLVSEATPVVKGIGSELDQLRRDTSYTLDGATLRFRHTLDSVTVFPGIPPTIDGRLNDWPNAAWRKLNGPAGTDDRAAVSLRWAGDELFVALRVRDNTPRARTGLEVGEGDHIVIIVDWESGTVERSIGREDAVVLLPRLEQSETHVVSLDFHGFMAKNIARRQNLRWTEFFLTSLGMPLDDRLASLRDGMQYAMLATNTGYTTELALPVLTSNTLRMTIVVVDAYRGGRRYRSLPIRNYPGNPSTFATLTFAR